MVLYKHNKDSNSRRECW